MRIALCLLALTGVALAQPEAGPGAYHTEWNARNDRSANPTPSEFTFINYFFTRATITNMIADPAGLRGVSLGPIGIGEAGSATAVGDDSTGYVEQRWIPVIAYSPHFIDGLATFRAQFEIDYTWGQAANQIQNNQGGGLNADQVNIQTKNVNVALYPTRNPLQLSIIAGTQPFYDSLYDPTITSLFHITKTGYKLAYMGSDATGLSVYGHFGNHRFKVGLTPLGSGQPKKATDGDPDLYYVWMATLDYGIELAPTTELNFSLWHLRDNTQGRAFAFEGLVPSGPSSTGLFPYTGVADFDLEEANGSVTWIGANFHHNVDFTTGDWAFSGFAMANFGRYESQKADTALNEDIAIRGLAANAEVAFNYGKTLGDVISFETMFSTGDDDVKDAEYDGVITLNHYGLPGAVWFNHKTLLLFPFTSTVSNYTGAVTDISNQGYGLLAGILAAKKDLVPDVLNLKLGAAAGRSMAQPAPGAFGLERGQTLGAEVNVELNWQVRYLMNIGVHAGYMALGDFFDATPTADANPYAVFTTFTWYGF
jgi:hypothetical protein